MILGNAAGKDMRLVVNVETDDRTVLFPMAKFLTHIAVQGLADGRVRLEAVCTFNEARAPTEIVTLDVEDAVVLARALIDAVYQGRTQHVLSETAKVAVIFNPNGFVVACGEGAAQRELFLCSPAILRLSQGILRVVDRLDAAIGH